MVNARHLTALVVASVAVFASQSADAKVRMDLQGGYGANVGLLGPTQVHLIETINRISGGEIEIRFHEPNTFVPNLQSLDAVGNGSLDAAWTSPGY
jgi:TRAP-type mannitol/chloroaromatic compound transport system substrate-binding protein